MRGQLDVNLVIRQKAGQAHLFPMEKIFEAYVGDYLQKNCEHYHVKTQEQKLYLIQHKDNNLFQLKPDFILRHKNSEHVIIADTKWKMLKQNTGNNSEKYGIILLSLLLIMS